MRKSVTVQLSQAFCHCEEQQRRSPSARPTLRRACSGQSPEFVEGRSNPFKKSASQKALAMTPRVILFATLFYFTLPSAYADDWPQLQHDATHSGITSQGVVGPFREKWRFNSVPISGRVQPIVVNGRVYIGSNNGKMYALDGNNGQILWEYQADGMIVDTAAYSYGNGYLYFGSTGNSVYALRADNGRLVWRKQTGGSVRTAPVVANERVYLGSSDGVMHAYNENSGNEEWTFATDNNAPIYGPAAFSDNAVFFGANDSKAYALNANTGQLTWKTQLSGQGADDYWPVVIKSSSGAKVVFETMPAFMFHEVLGRATAVIYDNWSSPWSGQRTAIINHLRNNPQDRTIHVLDALTGAEDLNTPILHSGGNNMPHIPPIGTNDNDTKIIYRYSGGISPLTAGMGRDFVTVNHWDLYVGGWNLSTQNLTPLDSWSSSTAEPNWNTKASIMSDETAIISQGGSSLYFMTWRGLYTFNLTNRTFDGILQAINDPVWLIHYGVDFYVFPPSCADESQCTAYGPKAEARQTAYRPVVIGNGLIFWLYDSNLVAVEGTIQ